MISVKGRYPLLLLHLSEGEAAGFNGGPDASYTIEADQVRYVGATVLRRDALVDGMIALTFSYAYHQPVNPSRPWWVPLH